MSTTAHPLSDNPFDDPFAASPDPVRNEQHAWLKVCGLTWLGVLAIFLAIALTPERANAVQPAPTPIQPAAPAAVQPMNLPPGVQLIEIAERPASTMTQILSIEPLPTVTPTLIPPSGVVPSAVILLGGGFFGWTDDRFEGDLSFSCSDALCGAYAPNQKMFVCGGWLGINGSKITAALDVIHAVHLCVAAERVPAENRSSIGLLSTSTRRLLVGKTELWPLLLIEVYGGEAPYTVDNPGK